MPSIILDVLTGIVRHAVQGALVWLVARGWVSGDVATQATSAIAVVVVTMIASAYSKYTANQKLVVAQSSLPPITHDQIEAKMATGVMIPSVFTPPDEAPHVPPVSTEPKP